MDGRASRLVEEVVAELVDLPEDKLREVLDFVGYLKAKERADRGEPPRGSAQAIARFLEEAGPSAFEPGEIDELLADIEISRQMDLLDEYGQ